jgi:ATP-dependent Lon protease
MEVLEIAGYTEEEKLWIARDHLVARQITNHGLATGNVTFDDDALRAIIRGYTREAGVRNLEREIGAICRKIARRRAEGNSAAVIVTRAVVEDLLGAPRHLDEEMKDRTRDPGVAIGLAWTPVGGEVLFVECSRMAGSSQLTLTGQLGDVMKESARIALSWFRANAARFGVDPQFYKDSEIHLHVPAGAIPKDGPSAGVTMVTALASALSGRPVRADLAMTGEITLSGRVLPVGGIKEKVLAARRAGLHTVILPRQNAKHVNEDLTEELRRGLTVYYVDEMDEVLKLALQATPATRQNDRGDDSRRLSLA